MLGRQLFALLFTYWVTADALCLVALRFLQPADRRSRLEVFLLTRALGPLLVSWILFHLLVLFPHRGPSFYVATTLTTFALFALVGRTQIGSLANVYVEVWKALPLCWPHSRTGKMLLGLALTLAGFIVFIGITYPIVEGDALGFTTEARLIYRDLGFDHYPTTTADPQTGYYYLTFQTPCLQSLYVWFFLLTGTSQHDVLLRTVAPLYSLYCALILFWVLYQRSRSAETALWGVVALLAIPVFVVHSYLNTQDPHRIVLAFGALLGLAALVRAPTWNNAVVLGILLGFTVYAHFFGLLTAGVVLALYLVLGRDGLRRKLATLCIAGIVAAPFTSLYYYAFATAHPPHSVAAGESSTPTDMDRSAADRAARHFATTPTKSASTETANEWLMAKRGQAGRLNRYLFGVLLPFTGIEWFGFFFWFFAVALVRWLREQDKTPLEVIMAWTAIVCLGVILSGVSTLSWSNPRYTGTLAPLVAYFTGTLAATWWRRHEGRQWLRVALLLVVFLVPLGITTCVRGAKVGITNPGNFYENLHSTRWLQATFDHPVASLHVLWSRYLGFRKTLKYSRASDHMKLLNAHDYFRAVDYMNCCTPPKATGLVIGRETYYFYYAQRRGASVLDPALTPFRGATQALEACQLLLGKGIDYVLIDSYHSTNPWYFRTQVAAILQDPTLATLEFEAGTARVFHLSCGRQTGGSAGRDGTPAPPQAASTKEEHTAAAAGAPALVAYYNGNNVATTYQIGRADLSRDGAAWVRHPRNPLVTAAGPWWDYGEVFHPFPVQVDGIVYLYYIGSRMVTGRQIVLATSTDGGVTFRSAADPALRKGPAGSWDGNGLWFPFVMYDADDADTARRWKLWYAGDGDHIERIGYAYSSDGIAWVKFSGNPVLAPGDSGAWDDHITEAPVIVHAGGTWYMYYAGCQAANHAGHRCQVGLATAPRPEGPYTKVQGGTGGPLLARRAAAAQMLTNDTLAGWRIVSVPDSSVFEVNEPVMIGDDDTYPFMSRIASVDSPVRLTLRDMVTDDFTSTEAAGVRSVFYQSVDPAFVYHDGARWRMIVTGFQEFNDKGYLTEHGGYATSPTLYGPWSYDMSRGVLIEPTPGTWDYRSAENIRIMYTAAPTATAGAAPTPTPHD